MPDEIFAHPRLAKVYDVVEAARPDLTAYLEIAAELEARKVLDVGCGTGVFALLLAGNGIEVTGVDPAKASLDVAQAKPGAGRVTWIHGGARALPPLHVDLATMTGNVAQAIVEPELWTATLHGVFEALRPGGHLVFETRDPAFEGWREWTRADTYTVVRTPDDTVECWFELTDVSLPLVTFRGTWVFGSDGAVLTSDSTLRFRERAEIEEELAAVGYVDVEVREAPDRPGREFVFLAHT